MPFLPQTQYRRLSSQKLNRFVRRLLNDPLCSPWFGKWVLVRIFYVRFLERFVADPLGGESVPTFNSYSN